jgi:DNA mismatch repair protein MSH6
MKGIVAHAGFPEISYGTMADKLVRAGYKVARVEQTETPEQLKVRKSQHKKTNGPSPKVVNREVCSVMTLGTRTFCYLDDGKDVLDEGGAVGPLLAIREILIDHDVEGETDEVRPVCEYGITAIDAVRGVVTIGQFADDVLRSRMNTLLAALAPSEVLLQAGADGASPVLESLIKTHQSMCPHPFRVEKIRAEESFPKSTALSPEVRQAMDRGSGRFVGAVHPWDVEETVQELHRRRYFPQASKVSADRFSMSRWPHVLRAAVEGKADLAMSSFGAALFYLQRSLIDTEILTMGIVKAYVPPSSANTDAEVRETMQVLATQESHTSIEGAIANPANIPAQEEGREVANSLLAESLIDHMQLDGTTLHNLEILTNSVDYKVAGSVWSKINYTKTPHGARLLRAWLLRPLFRKADIDRRADAVQELVSGAAAVALTEASAVLSKCGDIERLLSRIHSMSGSTGLEQDDDNEGIHPSNRAVLYEVGTYTKRKVGDFSKILNGLQHAAQIPEIFQGINLESGLLQKIVRSVDQGGCFPNMCDQLDWFISNFDCDKAAKGLFEPNRGIDAAYDEACETIDRIQADLTEYKKVMCDTVLKPRSLATSSWKYVNVNPESKDKYLIELPASIAVPDDFIMKGKRGSGPKQVNKYQTAAVQELVDELEHAYEIQKERKSKGLQLIFAKFDASRNVWAAAAQATALLDALGSLARVASKAGYIRPTILECFPDDSPRINIVQGRHPCVENNMGSTGFIPNDLSLGLETEDGVSPRVLLLSGPNMGGKSVSHV